MLSDTSRQAFETALTRLDNVRALVLGDIILDRYVIGEVARISPEAPVPVLLQKRQRATLGGAGNVALHFGALGASAVLIGLAGEDAPADEIERLARVVGLDTYVVRDAGRTTTVKTRILANNQQMIRIDEETPHVVSGAARAALLAAVERHIEGVDVVVLSDYAKGVLGGGLAADVIAIARRAGKRVFVDPKMTDFNAYRGASLVKPNLKEIGAALGTTPRDDDAAAAACRSALDRFDIAAILLTRSDQGMTLLERGGLPVHVRAEARQVFDVSGAGDTAIATIAAGVGAGLSLADATRLGNAAAGVVVGKAGTATVSRHELRHALGLDHPHTPVSRDAAREFARAWRAEGKVIGFTNGVFDLLHSGHLQSLEQAAALCDVLVVGVNSDMSVKRLKGPGRPVQDEVTRARLLACLDFCDLVTIFDEDTPADLIAAIEPDVLVKGGDYREHEVVGADFVKARGGRVVLLPLLPGVSTTSTVARLTQSPSNADVTRGKS